MLGSIVILLLILANAIFAMSEMALVSAKKIRLEQKSSEGDKQAKRALALMNQPNQFLSTVQIGITLVGVLAGAFGGSTLSKPLARVLDNIEFLAAYSETLSFVLVVVMITYLSLVVGELVPKRIALASPENIAMRIAGPMTVLARLTRPFVWFLGASTSGLLRLLGVKPEEVASITEEEVALLLEQATQAGVVEETEQDIVENVFLLGDRWVSTVMTPRRDIVYLNIQDVKAEEDLKASIEAKPLSRYVISDGELDKVIGIIHVRDLFLHEGQGLSLKELAKAPLFVPETMPVLSLLEQFKETGVHLALVMDEYGSVEGLVTLNDVLEALIGDVEFSEAQAVQRDENSWLVDGLMTMADFQEMFDLTDLPEGATKDYQTLGGFALSFLGHIPKVAEQFSWDRFQFEVVDMDGSRVDKLLLKRLSEEEKEA